MCPEVEFIISSSRIYYILVLPVDSQQAVCAYRNTTVNVLLTSFDHVDSKELLMAEAAERNMSVYLGMPGMPQQDGAQWNVDVALLPSFYEFTRRVLIDYVVRFQNYSSFKGVYQSQELSLGADSPDDLYPGTHPARSMQCRSRSLDSIRFDAMRFDGLQCIKSLHNSSRRTSRVVYWFYRHTSMSICHRSTTQSLTTKPTSRCDSPLLLSLSLSLSLTLSIVLNSDWHERDQQ